MLRIIASKSPRRSGSRVLLLLGALFCTALTGCLNGFVYQHTTKPLDVNFKETPSHLENQLGEARGDSWKTLVIPLVVVAGRLQFDWGDDSIAAAVENAGLREVHYADLETRSILRIWTQRWVHVYGTDE